MNEIPRVEYALLNGSGTWGIDFPEECNDKSVTVLKDNLIFKTPYGDTVPCKLIHLAAENEGEIEKDVLAIPMHGWRFGDDKDYPRIQCSDQVFWVLQQAGVKKIIGESSVGALNRLLEPHDFVVADDFIEDRVNRGTTFLATDIRVKNAFCPEMRSILIEEAQKLYPRVMKRGTYVVFEGPRFESPAEIRRMQQWGGDIVAQSLTPEIYYARTIGACYASIHVISNYAEGSGNWDINHMINLYLSCGLTMGHILLNAMKRVNLDGSCDCNTNYQGMSNYHLVRKAKGKVARID